jgi:hypothetical protein
MLQELAAATPSETGPAGDDGALDPAAFNGLNIPSKYTFTNTSWPGGGDLQVITVRDFAAGELDGSSDTILIHFSVFNSQAVYAYWTPIGESRVQILGGAGGSATVAGGMSQLFLAEVPNVGHGPFLRSAAAVIVLGAIPTLTYKIASIIDVHGSAVPNWMAYGGKLEVGVQSLAASQNFGIMV